MKKIIMKVWKICIHLCVFELYPKKSSASMASSASSLAFGFGRLACSISALESNGGKCSMYSSFNFSVYLCEHTKPNAFMICENSIEPVLFLSVSCL